jgi:hypothetical protein
VAAADVGQITLYHADTAAAMGAAFQPELTPGKTYKWLRPAVVGSANSAKLAVSDGVEKVYLLDVVEQPQPHLAAVATGDVGPSPLTTPLAVLGETIVAGTEAGQLAKFAAADLAPQESMELGGRIVWGPHPAASGLLVGLDTGELVMLNANGSIAWRRATEHGFVTGTPLTAGDSLLVAHAAGGVARIAVGDGAEQAYVELGQPVVAGPVAMGQRLVVSASDGTLLVINSP